jgi:hypothetical protein
MLALIAVCTFTAFADAIVWSKAMAKLLVAAAVAAALANVGPAGAQVRPARPIAAAAGGPIVRPMAARMQTLLGQPVLIGHVDGSASRLAVERLA